MAEKRREHFACWMYTKQLGEGTEGLPPPLPTAQPGRPPAAWLSPSLGAGAASLPARQIRGRAGFMYY